VPPRVLVLAAVVAVHAGVLLLWLAETRSRLVRSGADTSPLLVILLQPLERQPAASSGAAARPRGLRLRPPTATTAEVPPPAAPIAPGVAIDWNAEAAASAAREIEAAERRTRQARALAPNQSPMFAVRPKRPEFRWDYARTHRVEPVPGLETIIHLNDECAIVLFVIIPFAGGCSLEKPPVRGDLFEHMHDPELVPDP